MNISGKTKILVLLAHPVAHVRAPRFFNSKCVEKNIDAVLVPWDVTSENLVQVWMSLRSVENLAGVVVTIPHKEAVADLCDELVGDAAVMGVCNVARREPDGRFVAGMYDGAGFVEGMRRQGISPEGKRALLVGSGGAATAIAHALAASKVECLTISNRTTAKAELLVKQLRLRFPEVDIAVGPPEPVNHNLIVNGTSLGMHPEDPLPVDIDMVTKDMTVAEVIMHPDETELLKAARVRGAQVHKGVHMVTAQVDLLVDHVFANNEGA